MQTTRPVAPDFVERRPVSSPAPMLPPRKQRSWFRPLFWVVLGCAVLAGSLYIAGDMAKEDKKYAESENSPSPSGDYPVGLGHVDLPTRIVNMLPTLPGEVLDVPAVENQEYKKGNLLLQLDDRVHAAKELEAEAAHQAAVAQHEKALEAPALHEQMLKQQQAALRAATSKKETATLLAKDAKKNVESNPPTVSKEEYERKTLLQKEAEENEIAETAKLKALELQGTQITKTIAIAKADVDIKAALLSQAKLAREKCQLRAPDNGKVLRVLAGVGDLLGPQSREPAIIFCPDQKRIVRAEVEQEFATRVKMGQPCTIQDDALLAGEWKGKVISISDWYANRRSVMPEPRQFNDVRTLEVIVEIDDPKGMKIGQRVRVFFGAK